MFTLLQGQDPLWFKTFGWESQVALALGSSGCSVGLVLMFIVGFRFGFLTDSVGWAAAYLIFVAVVGGLGWTLIEPGHIKAVAFRGTFDGLSLLPLMLAKTVLMLAFFLPVHAGLFAANNLDKRFGRKLVPPDDR
jgi:hypothetical protein